MHIPNWICYPSQNRILECPRHVADCSYPCESLSSSLISPLSIARPAAAAMALLWPVTAPARGVHFECRASKEVVRPRPSSPLPTGSKIFKLPPRIGPLFWPWEKVLFSFLFVVLFCTVHHYLVCYGTMNY